MNGIPIGILMMRWMATTGIENVPKALRKARKSSLMRRVKHPIFQLTDTIKAQGKRKKGSSPHLQFILQLPAMSSSWDMLAIPYLCKPNQYLPLLDHALP